MSLDSMVVPGRPFVTVMSAEPGGMAERILQEIANPQRRGNSMRNPRTLEGFENGEARILVGVGDKRVGFILKTPAASEGLLLQDIEGDTVSLKPRRDGDRHILQIGRRIPATRISMVANQIVAVFVCHGSGWRDSIGEEFLLPYGKEPAPAGSRARRRGERSLRNSRSPFF